MTVHAATVGSCCGHNFNLHDLRMEGKCLACHCGAFIPDEGDVEENQDVRQCQARHGQHMDWRCKFFNTAMTRHDGLHKYTDERSITHFWTDLEAMWPAIPDTAVPASAKQVGGNHYKKFKIQPWDVIDEYGLDFYAGNALKYLLRQKNDRLEDLKKARHYLDKLIELEEGK